MDQENHKVILTIVASTNLKIIQDLFSLEDEDVDSTEKAYILSALGATNPRRREIPRLKNFYEIVPRYNIK